MQFPNSSFTVFTGVKLIGLTAGFKPGILKPGGGFRLIFEIFHYFCFYFELEFLGKINSRNNLQDLQW